MSQKKKSVYSGIADDILDKIVNNVYPIGSLLPPEREFMAIYNVQRTTVRRGLDILSKSGYIKKVAGLGSVVNSKVPAEQSKEASPLPFAPAQGHDTALIFTEKKLDSLPRLMLDLISNLTKASGCFITESLDDSEKSASVIALDTIPDTDGPLCLALCQSDDRRSVILDNDKGAYIALTYLEELGHSKIAYIGTSNGFSFENAAYDSFCAVNSFLDEELINLQGADEKSGFDGFSELFRRHGKKFSAVCTVNDEAAKGVIKAAKYYKLRVPEDISVLSLCSSTGKDIDGVFYDCSALSQEILDSLASSRRISTVLFGGTVVKNGTCAPTKAAESDAGNMSDFLL